MMKNYTSAPCGKRTEWRESSRESARALSKVSSKKPMK